MFHSHSERNHHDDKFSIYHSVGDYVKASCMGVGELLAHRDGAGEFAVPVKRRKIRGRV